jgi:23S rRNA (uracil1939-C5)-methyltransferase
MKKGDLVAGLRLENMAAEGKCVARHEGRVVFVEGGAPGDVVTIALTKIKSNFWEGRVTTLEQPSPFRDTPFCTHFGLCGGCSWQHIQYQNQLQYKQQQVVDSLERIGGLALPVVQPIIGSQQTSFYRNKLDYTFTASRWLTQDELAARGHEALVKPASGLGYHMPRMYDRVFDVEQCHLQPEPSNSIRLLARATALKHNIPFFDLRKQIGFLRTLTIRTAHVQHGQAQDVMVILQVTYDEMPWIDVMLKALTDAFPQITSANYIINGKRNDSFHDLNVVCWQGRPYITEHMQAPDGGTLQFRVGPKSFYQTNSVQAQRLYRVAYDMARLTGSELVYDLYTGTGTIANFVARQARQVVGLEYVAAAIADARVNAELNGITNTAFFAGDMKDLLNEDFLAMHGRPEVVITDPPRAGMHEDVCRMLLQAAPQRMVYVSCNPATQARDLQILTAGYKVTAVQPVDMFPQTTHVENVVCLERR